VCPQKGLTGTLARKDARERAYRDVLAALPADPSCSHTARTPR
jgi:hypothetical protein